MESRFRLRIGTDRDLALGPGKVALLEAIRETGSISAAGRKLGMSYRRAWLLVDAMNRAFRLPVITTVTGGREGGGTALTETGQEIIRRYRKIEALACAAAEREIDAIGKLMRD
ncbi:MAG: LysR family transcriptional regulator [Betaproteobacteria bacterium]|nr:MAG: LysR family transcriptional regulator [Betaproteobacteria bacterium]RPI48488.1 MAG: LysR family transcriptional regulator [Betaproteobacteria bacterium]